MQEQHIKPSAYGFRSIKPKSRNERRGMKDKVALEKSRINQRVGWQARMQQQNAPETSALLTSCQQGSAGYLSNADRFHTDTVGEEHALRQEEIQKRLNAAEFRRNQTHKRDEDRWNQMEEKQRKEEEHWKQLRDEGSKAKKNQSNVSYDIMTLQYAQNAGGEQQKYVDDMVRYRAAQRTNMLVVKGDTRARYNIINGEDRTALKDPDPVPRPENNSARSGYNSASISNNNYNVGYGAAPPVSSRRGAAIQTSSFQLG